MKLTSKAMPASEGFKAKRTARLDALAQISVPAGVTRMAVISGRGRS